MLPPGAVERPVGEHDDVGVGARGLGRGGEQRLAPAARARRRPSAPSARRRRAAPPGSARARPSRRRCRSGCGCCPRARAGGRRARGRRRARRPRPSGRPAAGRRRRWARSGSAPRTTSSGMTPSRTARRGAVHVGHEAVERVHALGEPGAERRPLGRGDHARHGVDAEQLALGAAEAHVVALQPGAHAGRQAARIAGERAHHGLGVGARRPVRQERLVPVRGRGVHGRRLLVRGIRHLNQCSRRGVLATVSIRSRNTPESFARRSSASDRAAVDERRFAGLVSARCRSVAACPAPASRSP